MLKIIEEFFKTDKKKLHLATIDRKKSQLVALVAFGRYNFSVEVFLLVFAYAGCNKGWSNQFSWLERASSLKAQNLCAS